MPAPEGPEMRSRSMRRSRLTKAEWRIILEAVNAYEAGPANFEDAPNEKRYEALISARGKIEDRL